MPFCVGARGDAETGWVQSEVHAQQPLSTELARKGLSQALSGGADLARFYVVGAPVKMSPWGALPYSAPTNLCVEPGTIPRRASIVGVGRGLYTTSPLSTGDYSVGGSGLWLKNGEISRLVADVTIASNMLGILGNVPETDVGLIPVSSRLGLPASSSRG